MFNDYKKEKRKKERKTNRQNNPEKSRTDPNIQNQPTETKEQEMNPNLNACTVCNTTKTMYGMSSRQTGRQNAEC